MKELLRSVLIKEYTNDLMDYLYGIGFSVEQADAYIKFAMLSMTKDIKMEQIYIKAIPKTLKEYPGLAKELLEHSSDLIELELDYKWIGNREFAVIKSDKSEGLYTIIINTE